MFVYYMQRILFCTLYVVHARWENDVILSFLFETYINHVISLFLFVSFFIGLSILNQIVAWTLRWNYQTNKSVVCNFLRVRVVVEVASFLGSSSESQIYTCRLKKELKYDENFCIGNIVKILNRVIQSQISRQRYPYIANNE